MLHEKINLWKQWIRNKGYNLLTTYVQNNLKELPARRRPAVIICPGGGYEYQSDRESEPIALEFLKRGYQAFILEYAVLEENETERSSSISADGSCESGCICEGTSGGMECGRRADHDPGMFGRRKLCALYSGFYQQDWFIKDRDTARNKCRYKAMILCYPVIDFRAGWPERG